MGRKKQGAALSVIAEPKFVTLPHFFSIKVHILSHKILQNLHQLWQYIVGQITGGDFAKLCGLLRIYEL